MLWKALAGALLLMALLSGVGAGILASGPVAMALIFFACLMLIGAAGCAVYPSIVRLREETRAHDDQWQMDQAAHLAELRELLQQSEKAMKEYRRARIAIDALHESVAKERAPVEAMAEELQTGFFHFQALEEDLQQTRQQNAALEQQARAWNESAIAYFEYLQRLLLQYAPTDPAVQLVARMADTFAHYCAARGLDRIYPAPGSPVLPGVHQVTGEEPSADFPAGVIARCDAWGYRTGATVIKPAQVVITRQVRELGVFI